MLKLRKKYQLKIDKDQQEVLKQCHPIMHPDVMRKAYRDSCLQQDRLLAKYQAKPQRHRKWLSIMRKRS